MKKILMISTGGTIACRRTERGLTPVLTSEELLSFVPEVRDYCSVDTQSLMNKDSTEILPQDWLAMAEAVQHSYPDYDGFVVCHGTDTMAYTAAALSYLIQHSSKPVVITGSQQPIDMETTDARQNLSSSFLYAANPNAHGICIVFDGDVIAGTRAKKTHTRSYNAFSSTNYPLLASLLGGRVVQYIPVSCKAEPVFYDLLEPRVALIKLAPGSSPQLLVTALEQNIGVVIESFGSGGLPERFYGALEQGVRAGRTVVMTTQVPNEGSEMTAYTVGKGIKERLGLIEAYDMTLEAVITKLMWVLAQTRDTAEIRKLFYTTIGSDILVTE